MTTLRAKLKLNPYAVLEEALTGATTLGIARFYKHRDDRPEGLTDEHVQGIEDEVRQRVLSQIFEILDFEAPEDTSEVDGLITRAVVGIDAAAAFAYLWGDRTRHSLIIRSPADLPPLEAMVEVMYRLPRWNGWAGASTVSVLEHCYQVAVIASEIVRQNAWLDAHDPHDVRVASRRRLARGALLHDASEVLFGDRPTPVKMLERAMLPPGVSYPHDDLVDDFETAINKLYDCDVNDPIIKRADKIAGCLEARMRGIPDSELQAWYAEVLDDVNGIDWAEVIRASRSDWWKEWSWATKK